MKIRIVNEGEAQCRTRILGPAGDDLSGAITGITIDPLTVSHEPISGHITWSGVGVEMDLTVEVADTELEEQLAFVRARLHLLEQTEATLQNLLYPPEPPPSGPRSLLFVVDGVPIRYRGHDFECSFHCFPIAIPPFPSDTVAQKRPGPCFWTLGYITPSGKRIWASGAQMRSEVRPSGRRVYYLDSTLAALPMRPCTPEEAP